MLLEIAIIVVSFFLFDEYNEQRRRALEFGQVAEVFDQIPEPADITASFVFLLIFAVLSLGFDVYEVIEAHEELKSE